VLLGSSGVAASAPVTAAGTYHPVDPVRVLDTRTGTGLAGGQVTRFAVTSHGGIPDGAAAVTINLTVLRPATAGSIAVFPGDTAWNGAASVSLLAGLNKQSMVTAKLGADGTLSVRNNIASTIQVIGDVAGYYTGGTPNAPGAFQAIPFQRAFDTRPSNPLAPGSVTAMPIAGHGGVPATGVAAVLANLTVLSPARAGSVSTWASDASWDGSASASFTAGRTEQDVLSVALGSDGTAMIRNNTGAPLQVVLDLIGYYLNGTPTGYGTYQPITPSRVFDTRGTRDEPVTPRYAVGVSAAYDERTFNTPVPEWGVPVAVVRFTVLTPAHAGSLSIYRGDRAWNGSASISFNAGASVQQQLTTTLGLDETFNVKYNGAGSVSVVADVLGYYLGVPNPLHFTAGQQIDPPRGDAKDISCPTATFCMAVQLYGFAEHWNGTGWSKAAQVGQATVLTSVSCTSASFCVAVGADSGGLADIETYDGTSWTHAINLSPSNGAGVVSCASASFCVASAGSSYATFDGTGWSVRQLGTRQLTGWYSLSCPSASFCLASDTTGRTSTFDGTGWSAPVHVTGNLFDPVAVSCVSASFCAGVYYDNAMMFDGTSWSAPSTIDTHPLQSVSCISSTNCRASDALGAVTSFDGTNWSSPLQVQPYGPTKISCSVAGTCALLRGTRAFTGPTAAMFDGTSWGSPQTVDLPPGGLDGLSCTSASFCMAVDVGGYALSYDGTSWSTPTQIDPDGVYLTAVSCSSPSFCMAVDYFGRAITFDGTSWSAPVSVVGHELRSVSCVSSSFCAAVGLDGAVTFNGSSWTAPELPSSGLSSVSCGSATSCVAATAGVASVVKYDGTSWSGAQKLDAAVSNVFEVSCPTASYCLVPGYVMVGSWNGSAWSKYPAPGAILQASCPAAELCVAAAESPYHQPAGEASVWDGSQWSMPVSAPAGDAFNGSVMISCPSSTFCMQISSSGLAYHLEG
jgi:hypothetical protein